MFYNLLISEQTAMLLTQYIFYGAIFVVGLIVLGIMKRHSKKPAVGIAIAKTDNAIKHLNKLLKIAESDKDDYTMPAKLLQLASEVGDLVIIADTECNERKNIAYDGVLSHYKNAATILSDLNENWPHKVDAKKLSQVKSALEDALEILKKF